MINNTQSPRFNVNAKELGFSFYLPEELSNLKNGTKTKFSF
jgi:hypothetical protein